MSKPLNHVFYVDDDEDILAITSFALKQVGGYEVTACHSGQMALEVLQKLQPDLCIIDVMMPNMSGPETVAEMRKQGFTELPIIFLTANPQFSNQPEAKESNVLAVISKPFDPMQLANQVQRIWDKTSF